MKNDPASAPADRASIAGTSNHATQVDWRARFLDEIPAAVALFDRDLRYVAASPSWAAAFGRPAAALVGLRHDEVDEPGGKAVKELQLRALAGKNIDHSPSPDEPDRKSRRPLFSARPHRGPDGAIAGVVVALRHDHSSLGGEAPQPAADAVTGLADRREFTRRLRERLSHPDRARRFLTVFAININRFRNINNLHGIAIGDQVLRVVADRLIAGTRSQRPGGSKTGGSKTGGPKTGGSLRQVRDVVARLGGDEFAIICGPPALSEAEAAAFADRVLRIVQNPISIGELSLRLTASIGFVMTAPGHRNENDVLRDLDIALRQAKTLGPSKARAWEPALTRTATHRYSLTHQLRRALDNDEFVLHYQPIVRLDDDRMIGAEALLRWRHPCDGLLPPGDFLHVLEETGLIVEVGSWIIREAVRQIEAWRELHGHDLVEWVSVNVSPRQFDDPAPLLATLREICDRGFPVRLLKLEITETTFMRDAEVTRAVLADIRELGIRISIDDFGTGYSSLNVLRRYPVDTIKIDAEFVAQIGTAKGDQLAQALLNIARMYDAAIVAEGIETEAQRDFLRKGGCGFGQGFLFGRPMDGALLSSHAAACANLVPMIEPTRLIG